MHIRNILNYTNGNLVKMVMVNGKMCLPCWCFGPQFGLAGWVTFNQMQPINIQHLNQCKVYHLLTLYICLLYLSLNSCFTHINILVYYSFGLNKESTQLWFVNRLPYTSSACAALYRHMWGLEHHKHIFTVFS